MSKAPREPGYYWWTRNADQKPVVVYRFEKGDWRLVGGTAYNREQDMLNLGTFGERIDPDRERRLVEAATQHIVNTDDCDCVDLADALRAYDPPPPPKHLPDSEGEWSYRPSDAEPWQSIHVYVGAYGMFHCEHRRVDDMPGTWGRKLVPGPVEEEKP